MKAMIVETGYYTYDISCGKNVGDHYFMKATSRCKITIDGYVFYINGSKCKDTKQYSVTEESTGCSILQCATDDIFIIRQRIKEQVFPKWEQLENAVAEVTLRMKPNLLLTMLML